MKITFVSTITLGKAFDTCLKLAKKFNTKVEFKFDGISLIVRRSHKFDDIQRYYLKQLMRRNHE